MSLFIFLEAPDSATQYLCGKPNCFVPCYVS